MNNKKDNKKINFKNCKCISIILLNKKIKYPKKCKLIQSMDKFNKIYRTTIRLFQLYKISILNRKKFEI